MQSAAHPEFEVKLGSKLARYPLAAPLSTQATFRRRSNRLRFEQKECSSDACAIADDLKVEDINQ